MKTIFSTDDVPPAEAFDYWHAVTRANICRNETVPFDRSRFYGELWLGVVADLGLSTWRASPGVARANGPDGQLILYLPGSPAQVEFARQPVVEFNWINLCLVDYSTLHAVTSLASNVERTVLRIPRKAIERRIALGRLVNEPIPLKGDAAVGQLCARAHPRQAIDIKSHHRCARPGTVAGSDGHVGGQCCRHSPKLGAASHLVTLRLHAAVNSQSTDPDANQQSIAAAADISARHANRLLEMDGTSIMRLMMDQRLEACREAIKDQPHRAISDIAVSHGFRDRNHFTRAFKNRFGIAPSEYPNSGH